MNKNATPIILIVLAIGIYFTFTKDKIDNLRSIQTVNADYEKAIKDSETLIKTLDEIQSSYDRLSIEDRERLNKMLPDNQDNVRLIIDINSVAARYGFSVKNIKITTPATANTQNPDVPASPYNTSNLTFTANTNYQSFVNFMRDVEASLRIIDISKITVTGKDNGPYEFDVELKAYWIRPSGN